MRNILKTFYSDVRALFSHTLALIIIIALCILPALYAWFNIYAFWDPYSNTDKIKIAVVTNDRDYIGTDGKIINIGDRLVEKLAEDNTFGYTFIDDADAAVDGVYSGEYYAACVIEPDFTYNMYNFLTANLDTPTISFYTNEKSNAIAVKFVEAAADDIKSFVNEKYTQAIVETLFEKLNSFSDDVESDGPVDLVRNALAKINSNLSSYSGVIGNFINANKSLIQTLNNTNSTLSYSIYLIGNERLNISDQIVYIEDIEGDLELINDEVNSMLTSMRDSVTEAIYKLNRLYDGQVDDSEAANEQLAELEREYRELIDYITHSGIGGESVEDALSALNKLTTKISDLRVELGLDEAPADDTTADSILTTQALIAANIDEINALQEDFENITVPVCYEALTGYDYADLSNASTTQQSFDSAVDFMMQDALDRIDKIEKNLRLAQTGKTEAERTKALKEAARDMKALDQELDSLGIAADALGTATYTDTSVVTAATEETSNEIGSFSDLYDEIFSSDRDVNLTRDLELVEKALETARVTLTEVVYPSLTSMLDDLQDSLGDVSSLLMQLSDILGKAQPIISKLGDTFDAVNDTLTQVQDLIASYCSRINNVIEKLDGGNDNEQIEKIIDFFDVDPEVMGKFLSAPVTVTTEYVYPVECYGAAMAPFYTMLAIFVGCVIINSILLVSAPSAVAGATRTQLFFGRYLTYLSIALVQSLIIAFGDIYLLGLTCVHPGLFILTCILTALSCSMLSYGLIVAFGNIGKFIVVVIMIIQIAGSGGSYPIEMLPDFFRNIYTFFPFPHAIGAMREAIAGLYKADYIVYIIKLLIFFAAGLFIGLIISKETTGLNRYMNEQLEKTELL